MCVCRCACGCACMRVCWAVKLLTWRHFCIWWVHCDLHLRLPESPITLTVTCWRVQGSGICVGLCVRASVHSQAYLVAISWTLCPASDDNRTLSALCTEKPPIGISGPSFIVLPYLCTHTAIQLRSKILVCVHLNPGHGIFKASMDQLTHFSPPQNSRNITQNHK